MSKQNQGKSPTGYRDVRAFDRSRPRLLASSRKLRHVQGISLRNLTLTHHVSRTRGKTIDDESLPSTLKTPAKTLALRESRTLEHSKSSTDIKSAGLTNGRPPEQSSIDTTIDRFENPNLRPKATKLRRRSTLNWATAPPDARQKTLEDVVAGRLADVFVSLHCDGVEEPLYVSEVIERTMNPTFRFFDMNVYSAWVTRRDEMMIKIWAKSRGSDSFHLLLELKQHLGSLQYIGKELEGFHHPFPSNCVLFHMMDGIYTSFTDLSVPDHDTFRQNSVLPSSTPMQTTTSFDALMRLSNLDDCIQDALSTQRTLTTQINALIAGHSPERQTIDDTTGAASSLGRTKAFVTSARKNLLTLETRLANLKSALNARRSAISDGRASQDRQAELLASAQAKYRTRRTQIRERRMTVIAEQTARIVNELFEVYTIEPMETSSPHTWSFTICSLRLPPSHLIENQDDDRLAAALGHASSVAYLLSSYLRIALPYPLSPQGSTSTILDPISTTLGEPHGDKNPRRRFPLYRKGSVGYRFDYGVFLLGKDVEWLVGRSGGRLVDLREIAGNLSMLGAIVAAAADVDGKRRDGSQKVGKYVLDGAADLDVSHG